MNKENKKDDIPLIIALVLLFFFLASGYSCTTISKVQQNELEGIELDYHCKAMDQTYNNNLIRFFKYDRKAQNFGLSLIHI